MPVKPDSQPRWSDLFRASARWTNYEDLRSFRGQTITWMQPEDRIHAVLLIQKRPAFEHLAPGLAERSIATCLVPYPTPNLRICEAIERLGRALGAQPFWLGDLDPIGLMAFAILREHSVRYAGIDDRWLRRVERASSSRKERTLISMGEEERWHFEQLARLVKDLRAIIGPRSYDLLASGTKVEVEGLMTITPTSLAQGPSLVARRIRAELA